MKKKVAIIDPLGAHGSSHHFYLFGQADGLLKNDVSLSLYTNDETNDPNIKGLSFYTFYKDIFLGGSKIISGLRWIFGSFISAIHARINGVSIFHFHTFHASVLELFSLLLVKILFGSVVLTVHDVASFAKHGQSSFISTLIYWLADLILTHNKFSKQELVKINSSLENKIHIVPHGNYCPFIIVQKNKETSKEYLDLPKEKRIILFFGMIKKVKGLEVLLKALRPVVDKNPDVVLLIAGKPWKNDFSTYEKIIEENNLSNNCILHTKFIAHEDVEHYYCASDLVVLPYKKIYQSGVLMMTLSYEKAALTSDLPPLKEIISDNENGFLFESENVENLTKKLNVILSDNELLEKVTSKGKELIKTKYSWDEIGRLTKEAYQTL